MAGVQVHCSMLLAVLLQRSSLVTHHILLSCVPWCMPSCVCPCSVLQLVADVCGESIRSVTSEQPPGAEPVPDKLRTDLSMMLAGVLEVLQARLNPLPPPAAEADAVAPVATAPDSAEVPPAAAG